MIKRVIKSIVVGVLEGIAYYLVYVVMIPLILHYLGLPVLPVGYYKMIVFLGVFVALGVTASVTKPPIGIVFEALSSLLGIWIILSAVGIGSLETSVVLGGFRASVVFEFKPVALLVFGFIALFTILRVFERILHYEE